MKIDTNDFLVKRIHVLTRFIAEPQCRRNEPGTLINAGCRLKYLSRFNVFTKEYLNFKTQQFKIGCLCGGGCD